MTTEDTSPYTAGERPYKIFMDGFLASFAHPRTQHQADHRLIEQGSVIYGGEHYVDEPFLISAPDGAWMSTLTIASAQEGDHSQRIVSLRSTDMGQTWSKPVDIESADGPEVSKAVPLLTDFGRIYAFYFFNLDDIREIIGDDPPYETKICKRVDSLGTLCFRYSDDGGRTWSATRYEIPVREFDVDTENPYHGSIKFGMVSAVPAVANGVVYLPVTKVGRFGEGLFARSEGVVIASSNLMTERNPLLLDWLTLPGGRVGLRPPGGGGLISEEHSITALSDGTLQNTFRTVAGWPAVSYSVDNGSTWTEPTYMTYADGRRVKCPRAANFVWKCRNGRYLYWYHNHGGAAFHAHLRTNSHYSFENRNPVWMLAGVEVDTPDGRRIAWSQPEIILYSDDPNVRISYPDLIEDSGRFFVTETNKDVARVHELDPAMLWRMWASLEGLAPTPSDPVLDVVHPSDGQVLCPHLPDFGYMDEAFADYRTTRTRRGFSLALSVDLNDPAAPCMLASNRGPDGRGFRLAMTETGGLDFSISDGMSTNLCCTGTELSLSRGLHHIVVVVDGGPCVIRFVVDGVSIDGDDERQFGWSRFSQYLMTGNGADTLTVADRGSAKIARIQLFERAILTSEAVGAYQAALR